MDATLVESTLHANADHLLPVEVVACEPLSIQHTAYQPQAQKGFSCGPQKWEEASKPVCQVLRGAGPSAHHPRISSPRALTFVPFKPLKPHWRLLV